MSISCWKMNGPGCVFDHFGKVPDFVYKTNTFNSPLEQAVLENNLTAFKNLVQDGGHEVSVRLKIGQMSCIEYAAMMGHRDMLKALIEESVNAQILREYFALADVVEQAYMISKNKNIFFGRDALAEANRYEAALFTAVEYNQPECVTLMVSYLGPKEPNKHRFYTQNNFQEELSASELAYIRGFTECFKILAETQRRRSSTQLS